MFALPLDLKFRNASKHIMLYMVRMQVKLPSDMSVDMAERIKAKEKEYSQNLQRAGKWVHIWRVAGQYANVSIFEADNHDELHEMLTGLPLFPWMEIEVTALARHPSAI